jgi:protein-L-isoaspartate(D-aspartate) O-methyltransferase
MNFPAASSAYSNLRMAMVDAQLRARGIRDQRVLDAMARVPRHEFTPERYRDQAYEDHPLPIAEEQTISQPYIVAIMLDALALEPYDKVLEIGTGSGYVTALLAELAAYVVSIERHASLADAARQLLSAMNYRNVGVITGDGSGGFPECAPYDKIIVSAAAPELPRALVHQLAEGGRMIVPVGRDDSQQLQLIEMRDGQPHTIFRELCRFVPLVSDSSAPPER